MNAEETLFQLVKRAYHEMMVAMERQLGLSYARLQLLMLLARQGELSQAELQRRLGVDGAAITRQVKQLEEDGLVRRRADPRDNRFTLVTLTEAGLAVTAEMTAKRGVFEAQFTAGLDADDLATLRASLLRLRQNARSMSGAVAAVGSG